jgi:propanol-preferring alcohol dehydrogenase
MLQALVRAGPEAVDGHSKTRYAHLAHGGLRLMMDCNQLVMIAKASGLVSIPDDLSSVDAAPLLCAGLSTFSALRNAPAKAGNLVAVLGIGGLGHLGVQYARHMGFEVAAIARGADKAELAKKLGAHHYIDSAATAPPRLCRRLAAPRWF